MVEAWGRAFVVRAARRWPAGESGGTGATGVTVATVAGGGGFTPIPGPSIGHTSGLASCDPLTVPGLIHC